MTDHPGTDHPGAGDRGAGDRGAGPLDAEEVAGYRAMRESVAWFPLGRDAVSVDGVDAFGYLQGQLSQDLEPLQPGGSTPSLLLSPQGKLVAALRVTLLVPGSYVLDVEAGWGAAVAERLARFKLRSKLALQTPEWRCVALRGPAARDLLVPGAQPTGPSPDARAVDSDWPVAQGFDLVGSGALAPAGVRRAAAGAVEALLVEDGVARMGRELDERTIPAEADLVGATVSFTKGCYTGQELVARLDARGNRVPRRLRGVVVPGGTVPPRGATLLREGKELGALTSSAWSPRLGAAVALAYVRREVEPPADLALHWQGMSAPCRVVELPIPARLDRAPG
ncbi:MAG: YgfZ/GcvT domain-containing protein [Acidimicrobiales bacterium]